MFRFGLFFVVALFAVIWLYAARSATTLLIAAQPAVVLPCASHSAGAPSMTAQPAPTVFHEFSTSSSAPEDLLGKTRAEVFAAFGVPDDIRSSATTMSWDYGARTEDQAMPDFLFHDDVVIGVGMKSDSAPKRREAPANGAYLGQPVKELALRLGSPKKLSEGQFHSQLSYGDGLQIILGHGVVVGMHTR